jgi:hypothetical protein
MKDFRVVLKVCEACGALWLRAVGHGVYCRGCALWLSEFPAPMAQSRRVGRSEDARITQEQIARITREQRLTAGPVLQTAGYAGGSR